MFDVSQFVPGQGTPDERARVAALADLHVINGGPEETFDRIARLIRAALDFPLAYVSLIDFDRQILKTHSDAIALDGRRDTAFCSSTIKAMRPLVIPDTLADPAFSDFPQVRGAPHFRSYWGTPLTTRAGFNVGALCVLDYVPRHPTPNNLSILGDFGRMTVEYMELRAQATVDVLTGVHCRRAFMAEANRIFANRRLERQQFSCVVVDVDHFKTINDRFGHAAGDQVLRYLGNLFRMECRSDTLVGRLGGEEFAFILPGESLKGAFSFAERLRRQIAQWKDDQLPSITASFGIAERRDSDLVVSDVIERADRQAYAAKNAGRNCTRPLVTQPLDSSESGGS